MAELPAELYKEVSRVLYAYAFDGIEPDDSASPTARALFIACLLYTSDAADEL